MKKILFILFSLMLIMAFSVSCRTPKNEEEPPETKPETQETQPPQKEYNFGDTTLGGLKKKKFYKIFEAPDGAPRQVVIDYMRKMSAIEWVASESWTTTWKTPGDFGVNISYVKGKTYYGLPYGRTGCDFNTFTEYLDDGVFTPNSHYYEEIVGNNCSYSMIRSYQQIVNLSGKGALKPSKTSERGQFLMFPAGSSLEIPVSDDNWYSKDLFDHNGLTKVFEAFALLGPGDLLYKHKSGSGHTRMVAAEPEVVRKANGTIDHNKSYITVIEQTNAWNEDKNSTWFVDKKYSFLTLYSTNFMPISLKIFNEENPVIYDAYIAYSSKNTPESIKKSINGTITSNFAFSYLWATITDQNGKVVSKVGMHNNFTSKSLDTKSLYTSLKISTLPAGTYTYNLRAGIARGNCDVETINFTITD